MATFAVCIFKREDHAREYAAHCRAVHCAEVDYDSGEDDGEPRTRWLVYATAHPNTPTFGEATIVQLQGDGQ